jgi:hypothetical protein
MGRDSDGATRVGVALLVAATLVGCGGQAARDQSAFPLPTRPDAQAADAMAAEVGGVVEHDPETRCVALSGRPVVWPAGTTARVEPFELVFDDGTVATAGDVVAGSGGYIDFAALVEIDGEAPDFPLACAPEGEVHVFNHQTDVRVVER